MNAIPSRPERLLPMSRPVHLLSQVRQKVEAIGSWSPSAIWESWGLLTNLPLIAADVRRIRLSGIRASLRRLLRFRDPLALYLCGFWLLGTMALPAASPRVVITPAPGFTITWDGNNGGFTSPDVGAGPSNNIALASNGTVPFTSS